LHTRGARSQSETLSKLKYELDEMLFCMKWTGGEDKRRTIGENLREWKQHLDDHARESPREHVKKVAWEWTEGSRPSMPAWEVEILQ
jgi:hypothetical protein